MNNRRIKTLAMVVALAGGWIAGKHSHQEGRRRIAYQADV